MTERHVFKINNCWRSLLHPSGATNHDIEVALAVAYAEYKLAIINNAVAPTLHTAFLNLLIEVVKRADNINQAIYAYAARNLVKLTLSITGYYNSEVTEYCEITARMATIFTDKFQSKNFQPENPSIALDTQELLDAIGVETNDSHLLASHIGIPIISDRQQSVAAAEKNTRLSMACLMIRNGWIPLFGDSKEQQPKSHSLVTPSAKESLTR